MTYTRFYDMRSGGRSKTPYDVLYIKGNEDEAAETFRARFDRDPYNTTCDCCGPDYSIEEYATLEEARRYDSEDGLMIG
jgi:hypothetical protein